jgi:hypothetical protein
MAKKSESKSRLVSGTSGAQVAEEKPSVLMPELSDAVRAISEVDAELFVERLVAFLRAENNAMTAEDADRLAREKICYHAAVYHHTQLERIEELYKGNHAVYRTPEPEPEPKKKSEVGGQESAARPEPEQQSERPATTAETEVNQ